MEKMESNGQPEPDNPVETKTDYNFKPDFGFSLGTGWKVMTDNFLRLFLVVLILAIVTAPFRMFNINLNLSDFHHLPWIFSRWHMHGMRELFTLGSLGIFAVFFGLIGMLYAFLVAPVFEFGGNFMFLQAVRKIKPDFEYFIKGFMENYLSIILANLLVFALIVLGLFALLIPGIIIACRLAFVPYIIMDKKLDPIESVEMSWKMTKGYGWTVFFLGFVSFFIIILGLLLFIVGIFPAIMWVSSSFASLYEAVLREREKTAEVPAAQ
jgi:uncharacterized membrane protein